MCWPELNDRQLPSSASRLTRDTLSRRASLTFLSGLAQSGARLAVGLLVTPLLVRELGAVLYGAWSMIQQAMGWLALTDLRPMGTLKFTLSIEQHLEDDSRKRRQVGAAIRLWAFTLPVTIVVAIVATVWAPTLLRLSGAEATAVRIAVLVTAVGVVLDRLLGLSSSVLRGLNLDFKGAFSATASILIGAALTVVALRSGFGLPGVAVAAVLTVLFGSASRYLVARRHVAWLGAERPTGDEFRAFAKLSYWLFAGGLGSVLFLSSDVLAVGLVLGPIAAAVYATTGAALRLTSEPLAQLLNSGNAGMADLCGRQEWARVSAVRAEQWLAALGGMTVIGAAVLLLNRSFLVLWLGERFYGGLIPTALLALLALQSQLYRVDTVLADSMMLMREKARITLSAGALGIGLGALLALRFGLTGMAAGALIGRSLALVLTPRLIAARLPGEAALPLPMRAIASSALLLGIAAILSSAVSVASWAALVGLGAIIVPLTGGLWYWMALTPSERKAFRARGADAIRI